MRGFRWTRMWLSVAVVRGGARLLGPSTWSSQSPTVVLPSRAMPTPSAGDLGNFRGFSRRVCKVGEEVTYTALLVNIVAGKFEDRL
jgi:hypothetical protein